jgi:hypothetical protein
VNVSDILQGMTSAAGEVTLTANAASTVVTHAFASAGSHITLSPLTANAAAEIGNGTLYISSRGKGTFTITHANNAQADRTFTYGFVTPTG